jgi:hypothetical protein
MAAEDMSAMSEEEEQQAFREQLSDMPADDLGESSDNESKIIDEATATPASSFHERLDAQDEGPLGEPLHTNELTDEDMV